MKISMWMLYDAIADSVCEHNLGDTARERDIGGALPYIKDVSLMRGHVYIADTSDLAGFEPPDDCCLIICGNGDFSLPAGFTRCIRLLPEIDINHALTLVLEAIEIFNSWYDRLRQELVGTPDLTHICEIGNEALGNYVALFDPNLVLLAYAALPPWLFSLILEKKRGPYYTLTEDAYMAMVSNPEHTEDTRSERAAYTTDPTLGIRVMYANVGLGRFDCRLCIGENDRLFKEGDAQLCEILAEVLLTALENNYQSSTDSKTHFREQLVNILQDRPVDERALQRSLAVWQWNRNDRYTCLRIEKHSPDTPLTAADRYICSRLEELLEDACSFLSEGFIICIAHLNPGEPQNRIKERLETFLSGSGYITGVSGEFDDITQLKRYGEEAAVSVRLGRLKNPGGWYHLFSDYSFLHFFKYGTTVLPAVHYCHSGVQKLMESQGSKVDYYRTLNVYLENDCNLLHTAKALDIHRTTLFYRLNRITEIIGDNLDDPATRVKMLFSFALMDAAQDTDSADV